MKILLIEDNHLKREKIKAFLAKYSDCAVDEAASYNTGIATAKSGFYDFIILDMSMPTFDRTEADMGGRFRVFGGKEIASRLHKSGKLPPFVVLTGYAEFSDDSGKLDLSQLSDLLSSISPNFMGVVSFDSTTSDWQERLSEIIERASND